MTRRLLFSYLAITLLVLLGLEIPFGLAYARAELAGFTTTVQRDAAMITELAEEHIEEGATEALPELIGEYAARTGSHVTVVDRRGVVLTTTDPGAGTTRAADPAIAAALAAHATIATGPGAITLTLPAASGSLIRGALSFVVPTTAVDDRVRDAWWTLAAIGAAVLAAAAFLGFGIARWITRPIRSLEHATAQFADGVLTDPPSTHRGPPELRRLAARFTRTATRLQHLLGAQRAFAADASHQLKTPLTALRLRLENLEPDLRPDARPSLDTALGEIDRLTHLITGLLALARLDDEATTPEPADLDATLADRVETWTAFAAEHHVRLSRQGIPAGWVLTVPGGLEQIIDNLLANALRATPPGTTIALATTRGPTGDVELHVIDQGPGMTAEQRARACDRVWRNPGDAHAGEGSGLGLTIVAQLARAAGGDITLESAAGGGLDATVRLRRAPAPPAFGTPQRQHRALVPR
ncbi:ATP-binding protein [Amycolatopsis sp. NPDC058278]|uniref:sensor histidine kinase n=1 Tax=Amycolatopsis sp. NPDC058278 TaxID=3346417 RepID=UPI0036DCB316